MNPAISLTKAFQIAHHRDLSSSTFEKLVIYMTHICLPRKKLKLLALKFKIALAKLPQKLNQL